MPMTLEDAGQMAPPERHFRVLCLQSGSVVEADDAGDAHGLIGCPPDSGCCQGEDHDCDGSCHQLVIHPRVAFTVTSVA